MTWDDVEKALGARYPILRRESSWLVLQHSNGAPIRIERGRAFDEDWLLAIVDVGAGASMTPTELLARNLTLAIGSFALESGRVVLRSSNLLGALGLPQLVITLEFLTREASVRRTVTSAVEGVFAGLYSES